MGIDFRLAHTPEADAELMTAIGVVKLYLSGLGERKSLGCSLVSLYFCHFRLLLLCIPPVVYAPDVRVFLMPIAEFHGKSTITLQTALRDLRSCS